MSTTKSPFLKLDRLMDLERKIHAASGRGRVTQGHIYVAAFWSGLVKVGRSTNPKERIADHNWRAELHGDGVKRHWISTRHAGFEDTERKLIAFCREHGDLVGGKEYFRNIDVDLVRDYARALTAATGGDLDVTYPEAVAMAAALTSQES